MTIITENIMELITVDQWDDAYSIMKQLRTDLDKHSYLELMNQMRKEGYRLFALFLGEEVVAVIGVSSRVNFYNKRHIIVHDLVTTESKRSRGYGEKLLNFIHEWAKENGANYVALESALSRTDAHRFYEEKLGYDKWCYSFRKKL
jgi:GNAT superfamily N-acetyltransferase